MKKQISFSLLWIAIIISSANAQLPVALEIKTGYSFYQMKDLRATVDDFEKNSNTLITITDNFPPFLSFGATASLTVKKCEFGLDYTFCSTGSRAQYSD